ncbi:hypothetical protein SCUP234_12754 [Seiridium cupressi]
MGSLEKLGEGDINDFSSYVTIRNLSDYDLGLIDYDCKYGLWPRDQPLNTIEARTTQRIHLKDRPGLNGSSGWAQFEVRLERGTETFRLDFADPLSIFSGNSLQASSSNSNVLSVSVTGFNGKRHPLYGYVDVQVLSPRALKSSAVVVWPQGSDDTVKRTTQSDNPLRANYEIGFDLPGGTLFDKEPIHESIVIAALIQSQIYVPRGTTYNNLNSKQWEYIRGLVWNDDPSCFLFQDRSDSNHQYSDGSAWALDFLRGSKGCMIQRSHFGDLQLLHAMGAYEGEKPQDTKAKLMKWLELMYKLACGDQGVSDQDQLKEHFKEPEYFNNLTSPSHDNTLRQLLLANTPNFPQTDVRKRALGTIMHIISDSYAIGHTQRVLKNGGDYAGRDGNGYYRFRPGTYGTWGPIVTFHNYSSSSTRHSHYDGLADQGQPIPKDLNSFNSIIGARDAIATCTRLINYWAQKKSWDGEVQEFLDTEVFALHENAQPSNGLVDQTEPIFASTTFTLQVTHEHNVDYDLQFSAGLQQKLASLEEGIYPTVTRGRRSLRGSFTPPSGLFVLCVILAAIVLSLGGMHVYNYVF